MHPGSFHDLGLSSNPIHPGSQNDNNPIKMIGFFIAYIFLF